jgi:predicted anti-sigma-YlaC factor YlaD
MRREKRESIDRLLVEYADGELEPQEAALVEDHLGECADCRAALVQYRESLKLVVQGFGEPPPGNVVVLASIERRAQRTQRRRRVALALSASAAVVCVFLAAGQIMRLQRTAIPTDDHATPARDTMAALSEPFTGPVTEHLEIEEEYEQQAGSGLLVSVLADIEAEEVAAICVAAGTYLEEKYGAVEAALERYRFTVRYFPETAAAKKAAERIQELGTRAI